MLAEYVYPSATTSEKSNFDGIMVICDVHADGGVPRIASVLFPYSSHYVIILQCFRSGQSEQIAGRG